MKAPPTPSSLTHGDPAAPSTSTVLPSRPGSRRLSVLFRSAFGVALIGAGYIFLSHHGSFDVRLFAAALTSIGPIPLFFAMGTAVGVVALQALRWWYVTRPIRRVRYPDAFSAVLVGNVLNTFLPARAGDVLRVQHLSNRAGVSRAMLMGTELLDLWSDKCGWVPAFLLCVLVGHPPRWMYLAFLVMLGAAAAAVFLFLLLRPWLGRGAAAGWRRNLVAGLTSSQPRRLAVAGLIFGALPWLWETLAIVLFARLAGIPLAPPQAFAVLTAFNLVIALPVPGSLGLHEAASSFALVSFGVSTERAIAFALLYHIGQVLPGVLGGAIALLRGSPLWAPIASRMETRAYADIAGP